MIVSEPWVRSKTGTDLDSEDYVVVTENFVAVVDGATSPPPEDPGQSRDKWFKEDSGAMTDGRVTGGRMRGADLTGGQIAAVTICEAIIELNQLDAKIEAEDAVKQLNLAIEKMYCRQESGRFEKVKEHPIRRATASLIIFSRHRRQLWLVGDCQALIVSQEQEPRSISNSKRVDEINSAARALFLAAEIRSGKKKEALRRDDPGRDFIAPLLQKQRLFQNADQESEYNYWVIDGFPVDKAGILIEPVPDHACCIVLASDGYPELGATLEATEEDLTRIIDEDSLLIEKFKSTKGVSERGKSYDDRAYVTISLAPQPVKGQVPNRNTAAESTAIERTKRAQATATKRRRIAIATGVVGIVLLIGGIVSSLWASKQAKRDAEQAGILAECLLFGIGHDNRRIGRDELDFWRTMSAKQTEERLEFIEELFNDPVYAERLERHSDVAVHAAVGLNIKIRNKVIDFIVSKLRDQSTDLKLRKTCVLAGTELRAGDDRKEFPVLVAITIEEASISLEQSNDAPAVETLLRRLAQADIVRAEELAANLPDRLSTLLRNLIVEARETDRQDPAFARDFGEIVKRLGKKQLVQLAKLPFCTGQARKLLLHHFRVKTHAEQEFADHWEVVKWLEENDRELYRLSQEPAPPPVAL